jgi:hypothetical protein
MSFSRAGAVVMLLLGAWLSAWWVRVLALNLGARESTLHVSSGYAAAVDLFLTHEWLQFDPAAERIVPNFRQGSPMARFYRASYLERDVAAFNGGKRSVFRVENGRILELDPSLHNIVLPFTELRSWPGMLTFRPHHSPRGELRGSRLVIELSGPTRSLRTQHDVPQAVVTRQDSPGPQVRVQGEAVNLVGAGEVFFGKAHLIGNSILFNNRGMSGGSVSISGEDVLQGNRSRMDAGDVLKLQWRLGDRPSQYALLWSSILGESPVISAYAAVNGHWQRNPERPQPALAGEIVDSLNAAFRRHDSSGADQIPEGLRRRQFDLALTLDADLETEVQRRLESYSRSLQQADEPPFRAAVTVMDAKTGELLALASYPTEADLAGFRGTAAMRERLLRNHNFSRQPVGSVAKIMLSAAILDQAPWLGDLKIQGYAEDEFDQILGISIKPVSDHPYGGDADHLIDFDQFIEHSSNRYAATLLTLATAVDEAHGTLLPPAGNAAVPEVLDAAERFYLGGLRHDRRPAMALPIVAGQTPGTAVCHPISTLEHLAFARDLTRLFGVPISRKTLTAEAGKPWHLGPGAGDDLIDTSLWLPLLDYLYGHDDIPVSHPFFSAAPDRENLAFNLVKDYRGQYLSLILGGGSSTWTNPQLCRIFSSLVTGNRPATALVRRIRPWNEGVAIEPPANLDRLHMDQEARRRLLAAMTRVAGPKGTAKRLNPLLLRLDQQLGAKGKVLGFFSKTGSPADLSSVVPATTRAVDALIAQRILRLAADGLIHYRDSGPVKSERPEEGDANGTLDLLKANAGDMAILRRFRVSPRYVVRACSAWNHSLPQDRTQFEVQRGRLISMRKTEELESTGAAYVFTMGIYDRAARLPSPGPLYLPLIDVLNHQPERALSVAISIQGQGTGPARAVPLAENLIREVLFHALETGW